MKAASIPDRREFKCALSSDGLVALRRALAGLCDRDRYAGPDGTYVLRSLYLDTPDCALFQANEREAGSRFKARVRGYPGSSKAPVFAEITARHGDVIHKTRASLEAAGWPARIRKVRGVDPALDNFVYHLERYDLRPTALVQYRREAWMSRYNDYARVSVDTHIECQRPRGFSLEAGPNWRPVDLAANTWTTRSVAVLELKWSRQAPRWMAELVASLDLVRGAFSKYIYAMLALAEDHHRDYRRASSPWSHP